MQLLDMKNIKSKLSRKRSDALILSAVDFANSITEFNIKKNKLHGKRNISKEYVKNNRRVFNILFKRGLYSVLAK
jgi:hypothetical protein